MGNLKIVATQLPCFNTVCETEGYYMIRACTAVGGTGLEHILNVCDIDSISKAK